MNQRIEIKMSDVFELPLMVKEESEVYVVRDNNEGYLANDFDETFDLESLRSIVHAVNTHDELVERVEKAEKLARKFVGKVESGRARSKETYADCKEFLDE